MHTYIHTYIHTYTHKHAFLHTHTKLSQIIYIIIRAFLFYITSIVVYLLLSLSLSQYSNSPSPSHLPLRLKDSIQASLSEMEGVHKDMSVDYSHGVVAGYTRKFLDATGHQKYISP